MLAAAEACDMAAMPARAHERENKERDVSAIESGDNERCRSVRAADMSKPVADPFKSLIRRDERPRRFELPPHRRGGREIVEQRDPDRGVAGARLAIRRSSGRRAWSSGDVHAGGAGFQMVNAGFTRGSQ